ncbi:hypothetical protein BGZ99_006703 [Dissophora globulifera]|uniref:Uncharacterized protein n=1 Tax=Dissophora globulifera TaxID=979702 RepID=A0A9P6URN3_9FUNG|nr:hypothetical protein BGZ99_006703 [Dissophora globulifera]
MKKEVEDAIKEVTAGLSNQQYFLSTRPFLYNAHDYFASCKQKTSRKQLENEWRTILIPKLKGSLVKILCETGTRLEKDWTLSKEARRNQRADDEDSIKMRKLLKKSLYEHRESVLEHSSSTIGSDFNALGPSLTPSHTLHPSSATRTPPYLKGSVTSSPEQSTSSPPSPPDFAPQNKIVEKESRLFFMGAGSLQEILLGNLRDGQDLPSWAKDRPQYTFEMQLNDDWGPRVTDLYMAAKTKSVLDHTHIDEIALLSGIVHLNKNHVGFSSKDMTKILSEVLHTFYSQKMEDEDMQRAQDAAVLWARWMQIWKSLFLKEKLAAQKDNRDPGDVDMEPVVDAIMSSYAECKTKKITSILFVALHVFRRYNNWTTLTSESDCMMAVVGPILQEIMDIQHTIKFTCSNASTSAGRSRKTKLQQEGQSRQPDIVGQTQEKMEVFYGECKGLHPPTAAVNTDLLRLAIFSKDSLDQLHNTLEQGPPLLTFQTVGCEVTFFLATKINNTVVHVRLSTVKLPSRLTELDLDLEFFFYLLQVQSLINITKDRLKKKRQEPLHEIPFPTLGTPQRNAALNTPQKRSRSAEIE